MHYHIQMFDPKANIWKSYKVAFWDANLNVSTVKYKKIKYKKNKTKNKTQPWSEA